MPYTILKIPKEGLTQVFGEFGTEAEAEAAAVSVRIVDPESSYLVEAPPVPKIIPKPLFGEPSN